MQCLQIKLAFLRRVDLLTLYRRNSLSLLHLRMENTMHAVMRHNNTIPPITIPTKVVACRFSKKGKLIMLVFLMESNDTGKNSQDCRIIVYNYIIIYRIILYLVVNQEHVHHVIHLWCIKLLVLAWLEVLVT